ncbi:MAG: HAD hydrolase-like protein [Nitrospirae bacterium]|nr:HAD hydrolase-like protein [Nitrospirota bacterium]
MQTHNKLYKHIIFDFDGVLAETNSIRFEGFELLFKDYPREQVDRLVQYAKSNGGVSRYEKIRLFFEQIRSEFIPIDGIQLLAKQYSDLVKKKVIDAKAVKGSLEFLNRYNNDYDFAIVSGSDQEELMDVCKARKIDYFFIEILGSPATKEFNIASLLTRTGWQKKDCLFVGDSINDYDVARLNGIGFIARDSGLIDWRSLDKLAVINDLSELHLYLKGE